MLLIHQQTKLYDVRSSLKYISCSLLQTFDSECPGINPAYKSQVIQMWPAFGDKQHIVKSYAIMTQVAECLSLLLQLVADLVLEVTVIHGNRDIVLLTQSFNCFG